VKKYMADWHLKELRDALESKGWQIIAEYARDEYAISASWEIQRSSKTPSLLIDFDSLDDMLTLPIERSYGCKVRGSDLVSLYFGRRGDKGSRTRQNWYEELHQFVSELDGLC
jgi:hypothetical protein